MRLTVLFAVVCATCLWIPPVYADIVVWIDDDGVRHFTNQSPPPNAEILMRMKETPQSEPAVEPHKETDPQLELLQARAEISEQKARFAEQQAELLQRIEAAEARAEDAARRAEDLAASLAERSETYRRYAGVYVYHPRGVKYRHHRISGNDHRKHKNGYDHKRRHLRKGHDRFKHRDVHQRQHRYAERIDSSGSAPHDRRDGLKIGRNRHQKRHFFVGPSKTRSVTGGWSRYSGHR